MLGSLTKQLQHLTIIEHEDQVSDAVLLTSKLSLSFRHEVIRESLDRHPFPDLIFSEQIISFSGGLCHGNHFLIEIFADVATDRVICQSHKLVINQLIVDVDLICYMIYAQPVD